MNTKKRKTSHLIYIISLLVAAAVYLLWLLHNTEERTQNSIVPVECRYCFALEVNGKEVLYVKNPMADWCSYAFSTTSDTLVCDTCKSDGRWVNRFMLLPSCSGRIRIPDIYQSLDSLCAQANDSIKGIIANQRIAFEQRLRMLTHVCLELEYYLSVHNVADEGFNTIASHATLTNENKANTARALAVLERITDKDSVSIKMICHFTAIIINKDTIVSKRKSVRNKADSPKTIPIDCILLPDKRGGHLLIQTAHKRLPQGKHANYFYRPEPQAQAVIREPVVYNGEYENGKRHGHGILTLTDGTYFDGLWQQNMRNGFGFGIDNMGNLRVGEWKDDRYLGERLTYTSDRIYGIDISRYQHDIKKKHYKIDWKRVRISHLGTKSNKRISGTVDYPVRFCYIKSTEGTTIRNRYFVHDYANAKKQGIRIGAYHFFSTKSGGTAQAKYFLNSTLFKRGDLPPVLDVEPSPAQIHAMGGTSALFANIRAWLRVVEQNVGVKPILYVGQTFVNKYLVDAPDIKRDYQVWIARYGEYKPDVRLAIWQLCADGRVNGIHGAVDINVFNGYSDQYEEFLEKSCIK